MEEVRRGGLGLTRYLGEVIVLQQAGVDDVRIVVEAIDVPRLQVKLRVQAPPSVTIVREELLRRGPR